MSDYSPLKMADDHLFQPGREKTGGRKLGVRNKLSERFLRDLHSEWERSGEATLKILAKENPEASPDSRLDACRRNSRAYRRQ